MKLVISVFALICIVSVELRSIAENARSQEPKDGVAFDEIVVASSLNIRKKVTPVRRTRSVDDIDTFGLVELVREKRQRHRASSSQANANANSNYFDRNGFGASAANAQAQGFQAQGPLGGFGASAANTQTQSFTAGRNGIQGSAGLAGSQVYNLPNGESINVAYSNGFSVGPDGRPVASQGNAITVNRG